MAANKNSSRSRQKPAGKSGHKSEETANTTTNATAKDSSGSSSSSSSAKARGASGTGDKERNSPSGTRKKTAGSKVKGPQAPNGVVATIFRKVGNLLDGGPADAIELLKNDHRVVDELFSTVRENEDGNNRAVFRKIKTELDTHTHIEEVAFYPYILERGKKDLKKIVREGIEEHRQVKMFLAELDKLKGTSEAFKAKLKVLMEDVDHHVKEEENEMFPMVRDQFSEQVLMKLAAGLQAEKAKVKKRATRKKTTPAATDKRRKTSS